jgi:hypothetical protein
MSAKNSPAETMSRVMFDSVYKKIGSGDLQEAIKNADMYIETIEKQGENVLPAFGPVLVLLYCLRALARRVFGGQGNDANKTDLISADLTKALALPDFCYDKDGGREFVQMLSEKIGKSEKADQDLIQTVFNDIYNFSHKSSGGKKKESAAGGRFADLPRRILLFVIGAILWAVAVLLFLGMMRSNRGVLLMILTVIPLYLLIDAGINGWEWYSQYKYNTVGGMIKGMAFLCLPITLIGIIPVCYWTGKGVMEFITNHMKT